MSRIVHMEILGHDTPALQAFYADVLGWTFTPLGDSGHGEAATTPIHVGVGAQPAGFGPPPERSCIVPSFLVTDVAAAMAAAERAGGRVAMQPHVLPNGATIAHVEDPSGNRVCVVCPA